jgi:adenylate cyclase
MKTVLLVDDSRLMLVANQRLLTRAGYAVVTAADGEQGLAATRRTLPDVILLDMTLPTLSGIEVLRLLKRDMATAHIPVIILSGLSRADAAGLETEGANGFISKEELADGEPLLRALDAALQINASCRKSYG